MCCLSQGRLYSTAPPALIVSKGQRQVRERERPESRSLLPSPSEPQLDALALILFVCVHASVQGASTSMLGLLSDEEEIPVSNKTFVLEIGGCGSGGGHGASVSV